MILFCFNFIIYFIKALVYSLVTPEQLYFKVIVIIGIIFCFFILKKHYQKPFSDDPKEIITYYKIKDNLDKLLSFAILILYLFFFVGGVFLLRIYNTKKTYDLSEAYNKLYCSVVQTSGSALIINILFVFTLLFAFIQALTFFTRAAKRPWIRLHIYYYRDSEKPYFRFVHFFLRKSYNVAAWKILEMTPFENKIVLKFSLVYHLTMLITCLHYMTLLIVVLYDLFYNNFTLCYVYKFLPYIFLYDIYIRLSALYSKIDFMINADHLLYDYMYATHVQVLDKDYVILDNSTYEIKMISKAINFYLYFGLNSTVLERELGGRPLALNYFKDWNYFKQRDV